MNVSINGAAQEILIDSGSVSSLIREENFKRLRILQVLMGTLSIVQRNHLPIWWKEN